MLRISEIPFISEPFDASRIHNKELRTKLSREFSLLLALSERLPDCLDIIRAAGEAEILQLSSALRAEDLLLLGEWMLAWMWGVHGDGLLESKVGKSC